MTKPSSMQHGSHNGSHSLSWIAIIRDTVEVWRKQNGWSRETAAQMIVDAHEQHDFHLITGISFNPPSRDTYQRMKVNADRIFRWLDEVTKDSNLLPANFIVSILAALPDDMRMHAVNRMLLPIDLGSRNFSVTTIYRPIALLQIMLTEASQAENAVAALVDGIQAGELENAHQELTDAINAFTKARDNVESMMSVEVKSK